MATGGSLKRHFTVAALLLLWGFDDGLGGSFRRRRSGSPAEAGLPPHRPRVARAAQPSPAPVESGARAAPPDPLGAAAGRTARAEGFRAGSGAAPRRTYAGTRRRAQGRSRVKWTASLELESELRAAPAGAGQPVGSRLRPCLAGASSDRSFVVLARQPCPPPLRRPEASRAGQCRSGASSRAGERRPAAERAGAADEEARPAHLQRRFSSARGRFLWRPQRPLAGSEPAELSAAV